MQIRAGKMARFFIQDEYSQIHLEEDRLILTSAIREVRIPFSVWSGKVTLERGCVWGSLTFYSFAHDNQVEAWVVQGLPWKALRQFVRMALLRYQEWDAEQCRQIRHQLPEWKKSLFMLIHQPSFLADSEVNRWADSVEEGLKAINISLEEAEQRYPDELKDISLWRREPEIQAKERNRCWVDQECHNWEVLFAQVESSPLNPSQQKAVLLNNDHNLILAGAGSGKTSVLTARVAYLLQSHMAQADELLMVAFGKDAAQEMQQRLQNKVGMASDAVSVNTFHQLGLRILNQVEEQPVVISPLATDNKKKQFWCSQWLKQHWSQQNNFKRWQKHLSQWPIAYLKGDDELGSQSENPKLVAWLGQQLDMLCMLHEKKKVLQEKLVNHPEYSRLNSELALVWPCYQAWQSMLKDDNQIDFHTMITRATQYVNRGRFKVPWKFIMVDEYQDISPDRLALIEAICEQRKGEQQTSLFAVGDDWQAIYQFAGSDVDLITGFSQRYPCSSIHYLDTTYRFNSQIGAVANGFIARNPDQLPKDLNSFRQQKQKAVFILPVRSIERELHDLNKKVKSKKSVLLLGRNHYHRPELLSDWQEAYLQLDIIFMTCHASKGKEADYVFILSVDDGHFPAKERQRHLDSVLSASSETFPHAEERRLFYVALTRAKEKVWVTHGGHPSTFVQELIAGDYPTAKKR
ncbi:DNA helicase IV [Vibrio albus]|uniref:DNA 3'-5' helicase n=1 Tax=Vibrio albus TaxID=2200953 RepID=A0A2U3B6D1_9VIBR|nr:DNA helicase IV [Vibrio albus]PWI32284.1 DNA helicase IV [Vibrio albus]